MLYDEERDFWTFAPERNDPWLNPYTPVLTLGWLANIDVNPPTSERGLVEYVSKYVGKAEAKSTSYKDMLRQTLPRVNSRAPLLSLTSKLLNKLVGERDWSAQGVCHILLGHPLQEGARQVITLDCRPEKDQSEQLTIEEGGIQRGKSVLEKYKSLNVTWHRYSRIP